MRDIDTLSHCLGLYKKTIEIFISMVLFFNGAYAQVILEHLYRELTTTTIFYTYSIYPLSV